MEWVIRERLFAGKSYVDEQEGCWRCHIDIMFIPYEVTRKRSKVTRMYDSNRTEWHQTGLNGGMKENYDVKMSWVMTPSVLKCQQGVKVSGNRKYDDVSCKLHS